METAEQSEGGAKTLSREAIKGGGWQTLNMLLRAFSHYIAILVMARFVTPTEYGVAALAFIVVEISLIFTKAGLGPALVQQDSITEKHVHAAYTGNVLIASSTYLALFCSREWIAGFFREPQLADVLVVAGLTFFLRAMSGVSHAMLQRELNFKRLTQINVFSHFVGYTVIGIGSAVMGAGYWAYIFASVGFAAVNLVLLLAAKPHSLVPYFYRKELVQLSRFGVGLTITRLFNFGGKSGDKAVTGRLLGSSALGIYEMAFRLMMIPTKNLSTIVDRVMFPVMSRAKGDPEKLKQAFRQTLTLSLMLILPVGACCCVLASELVVSLLGPQWLKIAPIMQLLFVAAIFRMIMSVCDTTVRALGAVYRSAIRKFVYFALIVSAAALGSKWGLQGVAIGTGVAVAITALLMLRLVWQLLEYRASVSDLRIVVPGCVLSLVTAAPAFLGKLVSGTFTEHHVIVLLISGILSVACLMLVVVRYPNSIGSNGHQLILKVASETKLIKPRRTKE